MAYPTSLSDEVRTREAEEERKRKEEEERKRKGGMPTPNPDPQGQPWIDFIDAEGNPHINYAYGTGKGRTNERHQGAPAPVAGAAPVTAAPWGASWDGQQPQNQNQIMFDYGPLYFPGASEAYVPQRWTWNNYAPGEGSPLLPDPRLTRADPYGANANFAPWEPPDPGVYHTMDALMGAGMSDYPDSFDVWARNPSFWRR